MCGYETLLSDLLLYELQPDLINSWMIVCILVTCVCIQDNSCVYTNLCVCLLERTRRCAADCLCVLVYVNLGSFFLFQFTTVDEPRKISYLEVFLQFTRGCVADCVCLCIC